MGLKFEKRFNTFDIGRSYRDARIVDDKGNVIFEQKNVHAPKEWSDQAVNIFASKYFNGKLDYSGDRENSIEGVFHRIVYTIAKWGRSDGYFDSSKDANNFYSDLMFVLLNQMGTFGSPYMFNVGIHEDPIIGSCFINNVDDDIESITDLFKVEARIFKGGGGSGTNLSKIRGSHEGLSDGGYSSGPVSFMKAYDTFAGEMKSAGVKRRAAILRCLDVDHPDIMKFITCKSNEEKKGHDLLSLGYSGGLDGEAQSSLAFQNANLSVRLSDKFMNAVLNDEEWELINRVNGECDCTIPARDILMEIAKTSWACGDPGIHYSDTIEKMNPQHHKERPIEALNPCSEICAPNYTMCNLAGINLLKIYEYSDNQLLDNIEYIIKLFVTAQDICINHSKYPYKEMENCSKAERPIGFGVSNIGGYLMSLGVPYDSDDGRNEIKSLINFITYNAYRHSCDMVMTNTYNGFVCDAPNIVDVLSVFGKDKWKKLLSDVVEYGIRNSQVTISQPFGTCGITMDCDSTGIEPVFSLVKNKQLVGGGSIKTVSTSVEKGLKSLGYSNGEIIIILEYIRETGEIVGAPHVDPKDYKVFQTALSSYPNQCISVDGHLDMVSTVQKNISGGISKTFNLPNDATVNDIYYLYIDAWKKGLKSIIVYRNGSKVVQPMSTVNNRNKDDKSEKTIDDVADTINDYEDVIESLTKELKEKDFPTRRRLPDERKAINHKFNIAGHGGYINVGLFDDGSPGEIFITMSKSGSTISGLVDSFSIAISLGLQYGVPLSSLVSKFSHMSFEPSGFTKHDEIRTTKSVIDYIFRWLEIKFLKNPKKYEKSIIINEDGDKITEVFTNIEDVNEVKITPVQSTGMICITCGSEMQRVGACWQCVSCGEHTGCG